MFRHRAAFTTVRHHLRPSTPDEHRTILDGWDGWIDAENYFFEWCVWLSNAVYGLAFADAGGWIALGGQALILASILTVTGIPATEAQALRSKGDACRACQATTSPFVPWRRRACR